MEWCNYAGMWVCEMDVDEIAAIGCDWECCDCEMCEDINPREGY